MPTYEYSCDGCGAEFEREQRISEKPVKKCPACGKLKARRLIGSGNFILKGSGWYSDLYSGPSNRKKPDSSGDESTSKDAGESKDAGDGKDTASKDSKPKDSKSESKGSKKSSASSAA